MTLKLNFFLNFCLLSLQRILPIIYVFHLYRVLQSRIYFTLPLLLIALIFSDSINFYATFL